MMMKKKISKTNQMFSCFFIGDLSDVVKNIRTTEHTQSGIKIKPVHSW